MNNPQDSNKPKHNPYKLFKLYRKSDGYEFSVIEGYQDVYGDTEAYADYLRAQLDELAVKRAQIYEALLDMLTTDELTEKERHSAAHSMYYFDDHVEVKDIAAALKCAPEDIHKIVGEYDIDAACPRCYANVTNVSETREGVADTVYEDGVFQFVDLLCDECERAELLATRDPEELRKMPYADYLKTDHWKETRQGALKRAGYRCQLCNAKGALHVHHRTYERRGSEIAGDLLVLCASCHQTFHDNHKVVKD